MINIFSYLNTIIYITGVFMVDLTANDDQIGDWTFNQFQNPLSAVNIRKNGPNTIYYVEKSFASDFTLVAVMDGQDNALDKVNDNAFVKTAKFLYRMT